MLFTSSFDPSAETNSTTVVNLFQTLCCVGESFFHPMSLLGVSFNSHITIRYHCMTWMETAKRFQVSALYHQPRKKKRLAAYPHLCDVRFMSVYVFAFLRTTREHTFFFHSSLCVRGRYGLVETCRLPLSFDPSRLLISLRTISRPMRGASPHLITFFIRSPCQTPPLRVWHIRKASSPIHNSAHVQKEYLSSVDSSCRTTLSCSLRSYCSETHCFLALMHV